MRVVLFYCFILFSFCFNFFFFFFRHTELLVIFRSWYNALRESSSFHPFPGEKEKGNREEKGKEKEKEDEEGESEEESKEEEEDEEEAAIPQPKKKKMLQIVKIMDEWVTLSSFPAFDKTASLQLLYFVKTTVAVDFIDNPLVMRLVRFVIVKF